MRATGRPCAPVFFFALVFAATICSLLIYAQTVYGEESEAQTPEATNEAYPKRELLLFEEVPIVISAAKREQPITESPSSISIITAEDIRRAGATNIADILRRVPGLDVLRVTPSDAQISARGFNESNNNDMLLLIDGRSAYVDYFGVVVWDDLPIVLEEIDRIEIIRGPGSALYGANAFSGVINIITKTPEAAKGTTLSATVGEFDTFNWTFMNADVLDKWSYKVVAGWNEANSFDDRDENDHEMFKGNALIKHEFDPESRIYFSTGVNEGDGNTLTRVSSFDRKGVSAYAKLNYDYENWKFQTYYNFIDNDVAAADGAERSIINNVFDIEMQNTLEPWQNHTVTWGANYRHNRVTSHEIIGRNEQENLFSVFVQDQYRMLEDMTLTAGVRFDSHPLTGVHFSPRASLVYQPWPNHIFRASVARAFRNPSFVESFLDLNIGGAVIAAGNRDLDAEEITSFELGYQTRCFENKLQFKVDTFYNIVDEIIEFRNVDPFSFPVVFDYKNEGRAIAFGGEISLEYHVSDRLSTYFNYSYQELKAQSDGVQFQLNEEGEVIDSSPRHKINAGIYGEMENGLNGSIDLNFVDDVTFGFFDASSTPLPLQPTEVGLDDYTRVDARIGYKFPNRDVEASLIIQNALDDSHREFPTGERFQRVVLFQVRAQF